MNFRIEEATPTLFDERAAWRYQPPYDFYDDDGVSPLNPERFYSVFEGDGTLAGFYYFEERGDALYYGLGLRPDLTGRGLGTAFVNAGLEFARAKFGSRRVVLDVAEFNQRAIKVYERAGFRQTGKKTRFFERWGDVPFVDLERA
jgi:aminoglycoside 6'-N-acetyltransferase/ribosomal-protein-alanine N-acetyltransferase